LRGGVHGESEGVSWFNELKYYEVDRSRVLTVTKEILEPMEFIEIAVLFGSILRRSVVRDIDIGLIMSRGVGFDQLTELSALLEDSLGVPVDLVLLNEAPPFFKFKVLMEGVRIVVKNPLIYHYILTESFMEYMDLNLTLEYVSRRRESSV
jgi:predicted nucleotidyltransferase